MTIPQTSHLAKRSHKTMGFWGFGVPAIFKKSHPEKNKFVSSVDWKLLPKDFMSVDGEISIGDPL